MPTQKNSASWDLQLGFNLAFKRLITLNTGITTAFFPSFGIQFFVHILFKNCGNLSMNSSGGTCITLNNYYLLLDFPFFVNFKVFSNTSDVITVSM